MRRSDMATLIEPDGTENISTSVPDAIQYCKEHSGWTWQYDENDE